ncbi:MAG: hypothetical protein G3M78_11115 [Candidatus Nitrohelix vancouverensis]|uniref:Uncharacterized protein n=1 Tax=Candidatus Nitrohelix vancouverensis TaxID=2705534 RepID=A0A7T0C5C9_9BACT|nr:MAG: hypothetical protein G3M78_11115 [Candidatus Nitrohelix vancouverensis]
MFILPEPAQALLASGLVDSIPHLIQAESVECGEKFIPLNYYEQGSLYAAIASIVLIFAGIFIDKAMVKRSLWSLAVIPLCIWGYINYGVDFAHIKKTIFAYDTAAENALANIAEAQDRYKSEQGTYIKNLQKIHSHTAGSHGMDACVRITKINATFDQWSAEATHVSSPNTITWDSASGSSLKKG